MEPRRGTWGWALQDDTRGTSELHIFITNYKYIWQANCKGTGSTSYILFQLCFPQFKRVLTQLFAVCFPSILHSCIHRHDFVLVSTFTQSLLDARTPSPKWNAPYLFSSSRQDESLGTAQLAHSPRNGRLQPTSGRENCHTCWFLEDGTTLFCKREVEHDLHTQSAQSKKPANKVIWKISRNTKYTGFSRVCRGMSAPKHYNLMKLCYFQFLLK